MSATDYLEAEILDHIFGKGDFTPPTNLYVALLTAEAADDDDTGAELTEATYTGYARKQTSASDWTRSGSTMSNGNAITFAACTAGTSTVTHFALCDAATDGNVLFKGALSASLAVSDGITPEFAAGELDVTAD